MLIDGPRTGLPLARDRGPGFVEAVFEDDPKGGAEATRHIDDMTEVYLNIRPYPNRAPGEVRVRYAIEPTRVLTFGPLSP